MAIILLPSRQRNWEAHRVVTPLPAPLGLWWEFSLRPLWFIQLDLRAETHHEGVSWALISWSLWEQEVCISQRFTNARTQKDLKLYLIPKNHHLVKLVCAQNQSHASVTSSLHHQHRAPECLLFILNIYSYETNWTLITWGQEVTPITDSNTPDQKNWTGTATPAVMGQMTFITFVTFWPLWRSCDFVSKELDCTNHSRS